MSSEFEVKEIKRGESFGVKASWPFPGESSSKMEPMPVSVPELVKKDTTEIDQAQKQSVEASKALATIPPLAKVDKAAVEPVKVSAEDSKPQPPSLQKVEPAAKVIPPLEVVTKSKPVIKLEEIRKVKEEHLIRYAVLEVYRKPETDDERRSVPSNYFSGKIGSMVMLVDPRPNHKYCTVMCRLGVNNEIVAQNVLKSCLCWPRESSFTKASEVFVPGDLVILKGTPKPLVDQRWNVAGLLFNTGSGDSRVPVMVARTYEHALVPGTEGDEDAEMIPTISITASLAGGSGVAGPYPASWFTAAEYHDVCRAVELDKILVGVGGLKDGSVATVVRIANRGDETSKVFFESYGWTEKMNALVGKRVTVLSATTDICKIKDREDGNEYYVPTSVLMLVSKEEKPEITPVRTSVLASLDSLCLVVGLGQDSFNFDVVGLTEFPNDFVDICKGDVEEAIKRAEFSGSESSFKLMRAMVNPQASELGVSKRIDLYASAKHLEVDAAMIEDQDEDDLSDPAEASGAIYPQLYHEHIYSWFLVRVPNGKVQYKALSEALQLAL